MRWLGSLWSSDMDWLPANCRHLPVPHHNVRCRSYYLSCPEDLQGYDKKNFFHFHELYHSDKTVVWVLIHHYTHSHWQQVFYCISCILCNWFHHLYLCSKGEEALDIRNHLLRAIDVNPHCLLCTDPWKESWHSIRLAFWAKLIQHTVLMQTSRHDKINCLQSCFLWWPQACMCMHACACTHTHMHACVKYQAYHVYLSALVLYICLLRAFVFIT